MERNEKCKICGEEFESSKFGFHLRKHKIRVQEYYESYYPKCDLLTGDQISYRDKESYFLHDFTSRSHLGRYLTTGSLDDKIPYIETLVKRHKRIKGWRKAPCQVELRTSVLPARGYFEKFVGDYGKFMARFDLNYPYLCGPVIDTSKMELPDSAAIWIDTREQTPLDFPCASRRVKLDFGDYTIAGKFHQEVFVERKSLSDFVSTISQGYERFQAEIERANTLGAYLVVCVEENIEVATSFKLAHTKCTPVFIFHRVKELMQKYDNIQFVFADGRSQASKLILTLLFLGQAVRNYDLQYHLEKNELCGQNTVAVK